MTDVNEEVNHAPFRGAVKKTLVKELILPPSLVLMFFRGEFSMCTVVECSYFLLFLHLFPSISNQGSFASCLSSNNSAFSRLIMWVLRKPGTESLLADKA